MAFTKLTRTSDPDSSTGCISELCSILKTIEEWKMIEHIKLILKISTKEMIFDMTLNA